MSKWIISAFADEHSRSLEGQICALKENDLEVVESIVPISARLISNKASLKFKSEQIETLRRELMKGMEN